MQSDLFKELTDFTDLRRKGDDFNSIASKQSASMAPAQLDIQNNQMILKSFRELREKLKHSQRETHQLRQDIKAQQVQLVQLHESQNNLRMINHQLKQKASQIQSVADQLKKKNMLLKESLSQKNELEQQLDFMKSAVVELQMRCDRMEEEKRKLIEMAVEDKVQAEERLNKVMFRSNSDQKYLGQMEEEVSKSKETILRLQNKLKKLEIKYDEEVFNKEWSKENFQQQKYESYIKELEDQVSELKSKFKKEKERKNQIEKRVVQLEEIAGIWNVKAEAYEGQVGVMSKKVKKMEKRMSTAKVTANKMTSEKICWEERFFKAVFISEQLINRVKRELMGGMVELAKSCQFRINKLKEGKEADILRQSAGKETYALLNKKLTKSEKKERKSSQKCILTTAKIQTDSSGRAISDHPLSEVNTNFRTEGKPRHTDEKSCHSYTGNEQNQRATNDCSSMQMKIRREREQMEKKLRERMLFRKIEVCTTPDKGKLREDYLKLIFQK